MTSTDAESAYVPPATLAETFSKADSYDKYLMLIGTLGAFGSGVMLPISNVLFGDIMDELNGDPDSFQKAINKVCISFCVVGGITLICGYFQVVYWTTTGERQAQKFREAYVYAIMSQEIGWFDTNSPSTLSTNVADLSGKLQDGMGRKFGDFIFNAVQFIASIIISFYLSWKLSLVLLASIPLVCGAGYYLVITVTAAQQEAFKQYSKAGGLASQTIGAIRTVNALNIQPSIISQYRQFLYDAMVVGIRKGVNVGLGNGAVYAALFLTNGLCYWYGGELVADAVERNCTGESCITGGDVSAIFFCLIMGSMALGQAVPPLTTFSSARLAVAHMLKTIHRKPLINSLSTVGLKPDVKCRGEIEIQNLEFAYPSRPNLIVCKNYSLHIKVGETVAFVGASGCGKSTVINLLLRFYDPLRGSITLDGYDIKDLNIRWLRAQIGYIGQEPALFPGSIAENIAHGLSDEAAHEMLSSRKSESSLSRNQKSVYQSTASHMTREEIMARVVDAAKMANAHDFIMRLPQQYDTDVGSNGMLLSGGQKQRIAIARALIKKPSVLLLDEATSALDAASERVVQQSIDSLASTKAQTIIVIAHRLSTIRQADKICVIQDGKIAEMGNHEQLLALNSYYADLVRLQIGDVSASASENVPSAMMESLQSDSESKQQQICDTKQSTNTASEKKDISSAAGATQVTPSTEVEELSKERSQAISRRIWGLIFRYPEWLCWGFLGALIFGGIFPWWGYMISVSQDVFYKPNPDDIRFEASQFGLFYILFAGVSLLSSLLQYGGLLGMGEKIAIYLRSEMFEALLRRDVAFFDEERNSVGSLTTALADDCRLVNRAFSESFARQMQAICNLAISLVLSFTASWKITLIILATFPLVVGSSAVQMQAVTASQYEDVNDDKPDANISSASPNAPALSVDDKSKSFHMNEDGQLVPTEDEAKRKKDLLKMTGGPGAIISTAFNQIRTVSAFSMHVHLAEQYNYLTQARSNARVERSFWGGIGFGGSNAIQFWIYALLFWYGAVLMRTEGLSFVNLMISIFALMMGALGLGQALSDMGDQKAAFLAADRIFRCIDEGKSSSIDGLSTSGVIPSKKEEPKSSEIAPRNTFGSRIEFKHVSFHYPTRPGIEVCRDYNFTIEAGETVAFVGPSGSGKSTIINLLLRFYDPNEGTIRLDGIDLRELNVRWIRSRCGYVGQEAVLFPGSVTDNIARGRSSHIRERMLTLNECIAAWEASTSGQKHASLKALIPCWPLPTNTNSQLKSSECEDSDVAIATDKNDEAEMGRVSHSKVADDVLSASRAAHAHDFIMSFPKQYETDVGEGSIMVSGGQKQRIAIARALIKQPSVLLLDEATSALDANSERLVQQSIDALAAQDASQRPTTIVIAHRLCTIRNADKICVVDQGEIVELGTHDELLSRQGGLYRQLWEKQQGHNSSPSNN